MIYNETYIGTAKDVEDLIILLKDEVPFTTTLKLSTCYQTCGVNYVEVWYDKDTNTVILK
jgi:hypothetical protein